METPVMETPVIEELRQRKKVQTVRLMEITDLTQQLAQALNRRDEISVTVLLSMREEPLRRLQELDMGIRTYLQRLPEASATRAAELLNGGAAQFPDETPLCEQVAQYRRLLTSAIELDRQVSIRMGGNRSFYKTFRE